MDMAAAQRMLQGDEFRVWRMDIAEYVQQIATTGDKELLCELNVLAMRSRITRLDKLKGDTLVELSKLTKKAEDAIGRFLPRAYKDFYYRGLYEIGKRAGIGVTVNRLDKEKLEAVTRTPWSGKNYSDRIWHNNAELGRTIEQTMLTAMHRGSSLNDLSRYVAGRMNVGIHNAQRLVQTELNYVQNSAALDSIKDAGMRYYRFIATLDNRTSQICREHDGMVFAVDDADAGYNMPPLHPRCRSTISGSLRGLADKPIGTRIARDPEKGKTVRYVPAGMKYQEWYKNYVENPKGLEITDITNQFASQPITPGKVIHDDLYKVGRHKEELLMAAILAENFGGEVHPLTESKSSAVKTPDYEWNGSLWELKTISTEQAADTAVRKGLKQIKKKPGGLVIDYIGESLAVEKLLEIIDRRIERGFYHEITVLLFRKRKLLLARKYGHKK